MEAILCHLFLVFVAVTKAVLTDNPRHRLASSLFDNYKTHLRPYCGNDEPTNVTLDISLRQLVDLDEPVQMLKVNIWIRMNWFDCQLVWNSSEYSGIDNIVVPYDKIWIPDLTLYDSVATETRGYREYNAVVSSNGNVLFKYPALIETVCILKVTYFPYDAQSCNLKYGSWSQNGMEIDFWPKYPHGDLNETKINTEWKIIGFETKRSINKYNCCPETYPDVTFTLKLERKPLFYIVNILIPAFVVTLIGFLMFVLPSESGEKVSFGITVLLSLVVFQMLVAESMPPSAATVPLIAVYFDFSLCLIGFACVMSVMSINFYCRENRKMPAFYRKLFLGCGAKIMMVHVPNEYQHNGYSNEPNTTEAVNSKTESFLHSDLRLSARDETDNDSCTVTKKRDNLKSVCSEEWKLVSVVLDRMSCLVFIVLLSVVTFSIFVQFE